MGASGDLAPLAHLAQGVIGEGTMWSPTTGWGDAMEVLAANDIAPFQIKAKDGLSLINGTQFICAVNNLSYLGLKLSNLKMKKLTEGLFSRICSHLIYKYISNVKFILQLHARL